MVKVKNYRPSDHNKYQQWLRRHKGVGNVKVEAFIPRSMVPEFNYMMAKAEAIKDEWKPKYRDQPVAVLVDGEWQNFSSYKEAEKALGMNDGNISDRVRNGSKTVKKLPKTPPKGRVE